MNEPTRVVVIGGGFGGLAVVRGLAKAARRGRVEVTLVDRRNHHLFQPLLYQVATAGLQPQDVGQVLRVSVGRRAMRSGVDVRLAEVTGIDRDRRVVVLDDGDELAYDQLVVAAGAVTADFGLPGVADHAHGLKTLPDALALRDTVLRRFEAAAAHPDAIVDGDLTVVVVGGGPTGVELAGAMAELVDHVLRRDHPRLDLDRTSIVLIEAGQQLLPGLSPRSGRAALTELRRRGVDVRLDTAVREVHADRVVLGDGEELPARTAVWVAGVRGAGLGADLGEVGRGGRVPVTHRLTLHDDEQVHVVGDLAAAVDVDDRPLPQVAPVAQQQGRYVADRLLARLDGEEPMRPFRYLDKGSMATIGRGDAVAELPGGLWLGGFLGWLTWLGVHLLTLVGFRNRVAVLLSWLWNYVTYDQANRLILHASGRADRHDHLHLDEA